MRSTTSRNPARSGEGHAALRVGPDRVERVAAREPVADDVVVGGTCHGDVAALEAALPARADGVEGIVERRRPEAHQLEREQRLALERGEPVEGDELPRQLAEAKPLLTAVERGPEHHAEPAERVRGGSGDAPIERERHHVAQMHLKQPRIGEDGGHIQLPEDGHRGHELVIRAPGQIDQRLDRTLPELLPDERVGRLDLVGRRVRRHPDAEQAQALERPLDGARKLRLEDRKLDVESVGAGPVDVRRAPLAHLDDERLGGAEARAEEVATGALEADVARQRVVALPRIVGEQLAGAGQIADRRRVRAARLGASGRREIELRDPAALIEVSDQYGAAIELSGDLEHLLVRDAARAGEQSAAYRQVRCWPRVGREQRVGRLLHAVVEERVGSFVPEDDARLHRRPQPGVELVVAELEGRAQRRERSRVAEAREDRERVAGRSGELAQAIDHEVDDVLGERAAADAVDVPDPGQRRCGRRTGVRRRRARSRTG